MKFTAISLLIFPFLFLGKLSAADYYWIGGAGNWSDLSHWATSSGGGTNPTILPGAEDAVYFDENSFTNNNQQVWIDVAAAICNDMIWTGARFRPELAGDGMSRLEIHGSLHLVEEMALSFPGEFQFVGNKKGLEVFTAGHMIPRYARFNNEEGEWILRDSFRVYLSINLDLGILRTNNQYVECQHFYSNTRAYRELYLGSSLIRIIPRFDPILKKVPSWELIHDRMLLDAGTSTIYFSDTSEAFLFGSGPIPARLHKVIFNGFTNTFLMRNPQNVTDSLIMRGGARFRGSNIIGHLQLEPGFTYTFEQAERYRILSMEANGTCDRLVYLNTFGRDRSAELDIPVDYTFEYLGVSNMHLIGDGRITALNSLDLGANLNWSFTNLPGRNLYWVGNEGYWEDPDNWSLSSGGPGGECPPKALDDVVFDANSFSSEGQMVKSLIKLRAHCKNMVWENVPEDVGIKDLFLSIYASLELEERIQYDVLDTQFRGDEDHTIQPAGNAFKYGMEVNSKDGVYELLSDLDIRDYLYLFQGDFIAKEKMIDASWLFVGEAVGTIDFTGSHIRLFNDWENGFSVRWYNVERDLDLVSTDFLIELTGMDSRVQFFANDDLGDLYFSNPDGVGQVFSNNVHFDKLVFLGDGDFHISDNRMDSLIMSPGKTYEIEKNRLLEIEKYWQVLGTPCEFINLKASPGGGRAVVQMPESATFLGDFILMENMGARGGNEFFAGKYSVDVNNTNQGWQFEGKSITDLLGGDRILCGLDTILIDANLEYPILGYQWEDGSMNPTREVSDPGTYQVEFRFSEDCRLRDTIEVIPIAVAAIPIPGDTTICMGDTLQVDANLTGIATGYNWSDGFSGAQRPIYEEGAYRISVLAGDCVLTDSFSLNLAPSPAVEIVADRMIACAGDSITLSTSNTDNAMLLWFDGTENTSVVLSNSGEYWLLATLGECTAEASIKIDFQEASSWDLSGDTLLACLEDPPLLQAFRPGQYLWSDGSTQGSYKVKETGWLSLWVDDGICTSRDSVYIELRDCEALSIFIPNAFSPNLDGINDGIRPLIDPNYQILSYEFRIYDRWGGLVFQSQNPQEAWEGRLKNKLLEKGNYFYKLSIRFQDEFGERSANLQGSFLLII